MNRGKKAAWTTSVTGACVVTMMLAAAAGAVVGGPRGERPDRSAAERAVIIELTDPPAARAGGAFRQHSAGQRTRMRQTIVDAENQRRGARGLGARSAGSIVKREFGVVLNGFAARLAPETIAALRLHPEVRRVQADAQVRALSNLSVPHVRAPDVWEDLGYRGAGATIAVIDTGVDYTLPDLGGGCFGAGCKVAGGFDFVNDDGDPRDDQGHGSHVAATAAGNGAYPGVAPEATILAYKVLDAYGSGWVSDVIAGIERAVDPDGDGDPSDHVDVISMSLGGGGDENDPVSTAVDNATAAGVLSVIAAGNSGDWNFTIGSPGTARSALTVGATDDADVIADFSSRGPTTVEYLVKPEITAPGVEICAASIPNAFPGTECLGQSYFSISGTSMATPHVSGAAALLRGLLPTLSPAEAKAMLQQGSLDVGLDVTTGGAGRLDARATFDVGTILSPAPLNLGVSDTTDPTWTSSATVSVRNLGTVSKTYSLGIPAGSFPAGVTVSVTPSTITVGPSGAGSVTLQLTVDNAVVPASSSAPFVHAGVLVASSGSESEAIIVAFAKKGSGGTSTVTSVPGHSLLVRDRDGFPDLRKFSFLSKDANIESPAPGSASDPTISGAIVAFANPFTGESDLYTLPSSNWSGLGTPAGSRGYRYKDMDLVHGPCRLAELKPGTVKVTCQGSSMAYSLDEPEQLEIGVRLVTGNTAYCLDFGGTILSDSPALDGETGMFKAMHAPAPPACPFVPTPSCVGNCGDYAGFCWCDSVCVEYGDCCTDYDEVCPL